MTLYTAQRFLMRDRMDWTKPHLRWIPNRFYRFFSQAKH